MNKIFAGVDVSSNSISVCLIQEIPRDPKAHLKKNKAKKFEATAKGVTAFLKLEFDVAILEPTGGHYSQLWASQIKSLGREVLWVGHWEIASYRESYKLFDKTDDTDALALACYGCERYGREWFFLPAKSWQGMKLRELYLQREFCNRLNNPAVNRLRQQLCHEMPEIYDRDPRRRWGKNPAGLWKAIAGNPSTKWEKEFSETIGTGLSPFSQGLGQILVQIELLEIQIEREVDELLKAPEFEPYIRVMDRLHFIDSTRLALLSEIFPLERFRNSSNPLGSVKLACGLGLVWRKSGNFEGWVAGGNGELRKALWRWVFVMVLNPANLSDCPFIGQLRDYALNGSQQGEQHFEPGKGNQRIMRIARRAITVLYRELVKELKP